MRPILLRHRRASLALALVLIAAFLLRFYRLDAFPPGVQHDEVFVSDFAQTILQGQYPIFFELNRGNEPLFMYLVAVAFKMFGVNVWALRATAALCGSAALVLTDLLARDLFSPPSRSGERQGGESIALLTAAGLAFSFWLLYESRVGLHSISTYLLAAASFYTFWRGWTRGQRGWLIASGVLAGLSAYTYRSGIFVPVALFTFVLYSLIFHRAAWKNNLWSIPVMLLAAALVYAPLGYYLFTHPESSLARLGDLSGDINAFFSGNPFPILGNAVGVLGMFGVRGDPEWRYNVAFRPVFDPLWGILFYAGLALALWRIRAGDPRGVRAPYALVVIWLGVMVLPSILSPNNPSQHRSVGAIGAVYILPAIALDALGEWIRARWSQRGRVVFVAAATALVLWAAFYGIRDYFRTWALNPEVHTIYLADLAEAARWLDAHSAASGAVQARVLVSAEFANDLDRGAFNLEAARRYPVHFFSGADTFVIPDASAALYVNPHSGPVAADTGKKFLQTLTPVYSVPNELEIYRASAGDLEKWRNQSPQENIANTPNGEISILGAEIPAGAQSGQTIRARMWWRVLKPGFADAEGLTWTARLTDANGYVWSEAAGLGYTPSQWQPGDLIVSAFDVDIPADAPPQPYQLRVALSGKEGVLAFNGGANTLDAGNIMLGPLQVARGPVPTAKPDLPVRYPSKAKFGDAVQLLGSDAVGQVAAGEAWQLVLFWKANSALSSDYTIRVVALTAGGQEIARQEETLLAPQYPTHLWRAGEYLRSVQELRIPDDAPRGQAVVRVFLLGLDGKPVGRADGVPVAGIEIAGRAHNFTRPAPAEPLAARLGDSIELIGYDLPSTTARAGQPFSVTLHWHALAASDKPYTAFVHLLNAANQVIGQKDSPPLNGDAPTDTWAAGEYLADPYTFDVNSDATVGAASLEIGFYDPASGVRLTVFNAKGKPIGDRVLIQGLNVDK